jgi:Na+/H+ antiporter NhaA
MTLLLRRAGGTVLSINAASWLASGSGPDGFPRSVPWPSLADMAAAPGLGFTISLFVTVLTVSGRLLQEAKVGILAALSRSAGSRWLRSGCPPGRGGPVVRSGPSASRTTGRLAA